MRVLSFSVSCLRRPRRRRRARALCSLLLLLRRGRRDARGCCRSKPPHPLSRARLLVLVVRLLLAHERDAPLVVGRAGVLPPPERAIVPRLDLGDLARIARGDGDAEVREEGSGEEIVRTCGGGVGGGELERVRVMKRMRFLEGAPLTFLRRRAVLPRLLRGILGLPLRPIAP